MPESKRTRSVDSLCRELKLEPVEIEFRKSDGGWCFSGEFFRRPEDAVFRYFQGQGYHGNACEGGAIQTVIKACCLDLLVAINTFHSEEDACNRYLEAQFTIHSDKSSEIVRGLHPNFPPVIGRVRRLFRLSWGVSFCGCGFMFIPVFPAALHSLRAAEKLSGFGSEAGAPCTAPASIRAGQAVRALAELP